MSAVRETGEQGSLNWRGEITAADQTARYITREEYLDAERESEIRSEYYDGVTVAMAPPSVEHESIVGNLFGELRNALRGKPCKPLTSNIQVWVPAFKCYYYPDVKVVCEPAEWEQVKRVRSLVNPVVIVEVLSPSTESQDRGMKLVAYATLESLSMYILVHQDMPFIEVRTRNPATQSWDYSFVEGLESTLDLPPIGCAIKLADIYAGVEVLQPNEDIER